MRTLSTSEWAKYRDILVRLSDEAAAEFRDAIWKASGRWGGVGLNNIPAEEIINYAYALVTKYGEAAATVAAELYDEIAALSGVFVPPAVPAETADYGEVAKTMRGVTDFSDNTGYASGAVGRLVKQAAADTTLQNAQRDGADFAWISHGDTCAFCIALSSRGWQPASKITLKNGHAEHIHSNCDCEYAVRFREDGGVDGYDPEEYEEMYSEADGNTPQQKINALRRQFYAEDKERINAQKRASYAERRAAESELDMNN